jgi:hypothetical protein
MSTPVCSESELLLVPICTTTFLPSDQHYSPVASMTLARGAEAESTAAVSSGKRFNSRFNSIRFDVPLVSNPKSKHQRDRCVGLRWGFSRATIPHHQQAVVFGSCVACTHHSRLCTKQVCVLVCSVHRASTLRGVGAVYQSQNLCVYKAASQYQTETASMVSIQSVKFTVWLVPDAKRGVYTL